MLIKTILNSIEKFQSFVYGRSAFEVVASVKSLVIELSARKSTRGQCVQCGRRCPTYDTQAVRLYQYVPLWNIPVYFAYAPRRVSCKLHGIHVEPLPWAEGKERLTKSYQLFLATWAKRLSWRDTAKVFNASWDSVYRSIQWVVNYGLAHRAWDNVKQIGVDEIAVFKGHRYLTCVYQLDKGCRRLLWYGKDRTAKTLLRFFREFGKVRCAQLQFVCSDMWAAYLKVIKKKCVNALNVLDRFHIAKKFNEAVDEVRREEVRKFKADGEDNVLAQGRWLLLKKPTNLTQKQTSKLSELLKVNLMSVKAYLMKEDFQRFWSYKSPAWADKFLEDWATRTMQSNLVPMKKVAKMLRSHKTLILNWFKAKGELSSGPVEGLNNKAKLTIRKAYGFKTLNCLQIALYHQLGKLKEPPSTHRFC
ncbi:MAG: ISL3 family transposase [Gammaproteobacteria bacterium CG11_big_fil_rev_8_21_14_0_20_46_22]|nr:MAG: ISL3 family transposase [Gammaproteobacteria bacterium CG12_big_fil_rev_8_21_14_0_65_46_12]PIR12037.1 MAG: ISL3 family transposase [Gammaproteobacteria bacterium CG11_big_fil_rev_8_21_14_0_20_46_22]